MKTISFACDSKYRDAFISAYDKYYNKTLPKRIAISSLYRAFIFDYNNEPWYYADRFQDYGFKYPETKSYETVTFKIDDGQKERFYDTVEHKPARLLRCFTADFGEYPLDYINRWNGNKNNGGAPPIMFYGF